MRKVLLLFFAVVFAAVLSVGAFAADAQYETGAAAGVSTLQGQTTTLKEAKNGDEFTLTMVLSTDTSFDYFNSCNLAVGYDGTVIEPASSAASCAGSEDKGYNCLGIQIENDKSFNVVVSNMEMTKPGADGYCCTISFKMKVVDAEKLKASGSSTVSVSVFDSDFCIYKDGRQHTLHSAENGGSFPMKVNITPMVVKLEGAAANIWTVSFNANGGNAVPSVNVERGKSAALPTPTRVDYTFNGWYTDSDLSSRVNSPYAPTADITLFAGWAKGVETAAPVTQYTVTFNSNGGSDIASAIVNAGSSAGLTAPSRSGYTFAGWYADSGLTDKVSGSAYTPVSNITLYAKWTAAVSENAVPKTGLDDNVTELCMIMAALICGAGIIIFARRRKISKGN